MRIVNALTVDVEDYFQVNAFKKCIARDAWDGYAPRVADNTLRVLDLFDEFAVRGTFFVLGWVAKRFPGLVKSIGERGHEVACHGYGHQLIYEIGPEAFREDIRRSKGLLEDITGRRVHGYRAPSYSIVKESLWALDILIEHGFSYDSSIFPVHHDTYGIPGAERFPHVIRRSSGRIAEFPPTTFSVPGTGGRLVLPVAGGGYLRLLPARAVSGAFRFVNGREKQPVVLYFHPWEVDPSQPRVDCERLSFKSRFRHYLNLSRTEAKIRRLLSEHSFRPMREVLGNGGLPQTQGGAREAAGGGKAP